MGLALLPRITVYLPGFSPYPARKACLATRSISCIAFARASGLYRQECRAAPYLPKMSVAVVDNADAVACR